MRNLLLRLFFKDYILLPKVKTYRITRVLREYEAMYKNTPGQIGWRIYGANKPGDEMLMLELPVLE